MEENKKKLLTYLQAHDVIVVATCRNEPTACTVYYGIDDTFNLYIVTPLKTEHGKNIAKNHKVACVVTETTQPMYATKYKIGVQIKGTARELTNDSEMRKALLVWSKNKKDIVEKYMHNIKNNIWQSRPHSIIPTEIKWFNEELFGVEGTKVFTSRNLNSPYYAT